ncbi:MAG: CRISPR system precrRNA processing endoribonuclease RAMP protein Cas6 [Thermoanaerobaculia bacterium]
MEPERFPLPQPEPVSLPAPAPGPGTAPRPAETWPAAGGGGDFPLPQLPYLRLRFTLASVGEAELPPYHGSLLRGAFGHGLRSLACSFGPQQLCGRCPLARACAYARLFEPFGATEPDPYLAGRPCAPRPFVVEPLGGPGRLRPGAPLRFDLLLFGSAAELLPFAVLAVERMAAAGLGARRFPFRLAAVAFETQQGTFAPLARDPARPWALEALPRPLAPRLGPCERLTLHFATPTRLKLEGSFQTPRSFAELAERMLRRSLELGHFYAPGGVPSWEIAPLLAKARRVRTAESRLHWQDWQRYSNRQGRKIELGGFVGTLELEGELGPFLPLLEQAEVLHVGKATTFGLGKVEVVAA